MIDLLIRDAVVVTMSGTRQQDIAVDDGRIVAMGDSIAGLGGARDTVDAAGLHAFPGGVDAHVHFNEPGRVDWEGAASGSRALVAGGGTMFVDMPLNSSPCTVTPSAFAAKVAALQQSSVADFALWGGLVPGFLDQMELLAERGVVGFKAFMCDSGLPEFARADDRTLFDGLCEARRLGLPVAVHAENDDLVRRDASAGAAPLAWLRSRPILAEVEAITRLLVLAAEAQARVHIVHVSTGRGVAAAIEARRRGVDVSIETCPHYLTFTEDDIGRLGTIGKCAPPLRSADARRELWLAVLRGEVDIIGSDHSPADPALKSGDFASAWGGIAGVQSTLSVLLECGYHERALPLEQIARTTAAEPASRFRLHGKGHVEPGYDADLALVELHAPWLLSTTDLLQRHKVSPYVGMRFRSRVRRTIVRGRTIAVDGRIVGEPPPGRFIRPAPPAPAANRVNDVMRGH